MVNKLLIIALLCIALYIHNLPMFFGMIAAYVMGMISVVDRAKRIVHVAEEIMKKVEEVIEKDKTNG